MPAAQAIGGAAALAWLLALFAPGSACATAPGGAADLVESPFAHPPELETDVRFWIRVYTEVTTDQGLLHDSWNLGVVYEVLRFDPDMSPAARERRVAAAKARYAALLRRFAAGDTADLTAHERRILHAFGERATPAEFTAAIDRIRFQLGQADRFHEGLIRAAAWEKHIARTLEHAGVPAEIAALPHVESSFNPAAYSRVGAAGLWQFMPSTARRYMRVDGLVDERLDPYRSTEAAANLMLYNYRLLGTWPLAVTAYNHGPGGLRRAQDDLGTSDIAVVVKRYQGATFGFASRNFYVAFLAALEVDQNAEKFFGPLTRLPDAESVTVELPDYVPVDAAAKAFRVDMGALRVLNPALLPPIWSGARWVPRGYALRLPGVPSPAQIAEGLARLPPAERFLSQRGEAKHRLRKGETLATVAAASGVTLARLLAANSWTTEPEVRRGQVVIIPPPLSRADKSAAATVGPAVTVAPVASVAELRPPPASAGLAVAAGPAVAAAEPPPPPPPPPLPPQRPGPAPTREPVIERQGDTAALLPAATPTSNSDTTDYGVGAGGTVIVRADETLGHLAEWSHSTPAALRALNHLRNNAMVGLGRRIKVDLGGTDAAQFEAARRQYHARLQDAFYATHRIASTQNYSIRRGESLWTIAQQHGDLPLWLVTQYNPDVDFNDVRPGSTIALPVLEAINRQ
jgi:membrane-bound lytic murein transglycosylase D